MQMTIYDASISTPPKGTPLIVLAGKDTARVVTRLGRQGGPGCSACAPSSRRASSASTASNLVGMGILPLQFAPGQNPANARPDGERAVTTSSVLASCPGS